MYKERERNTSVCLECGDEIKYGRSDKKFCSDACKNRWHNRQSHDSRLFRQKVNTALEKNYIILETLSRTRLRNIPVSDMESMGFVKSVFTSFRRRHDRDVYMCYDMRYSVSGGVVSSISRVKDFSECLTVV